MTVTFPAEAPPAPATAGDTGAPVTTVTSSSALASAISAAENSNASSDIVIDGVLVAGKIIEGYNWNGTLAGVNPGNKLRIFGINGGGMTYTGSSGEGAVVKLKECNGVELHSLELDGESTGANGAYAIITIGARWDNDTNRGNNFNSVVSHCTAHHSRQALIKCDGDGASSDTAITWNYLHHSGMSGGTGEGYGEGVYIGDGNTKRSHDSVLVEGNRMEDINDGEAINQKENCTGVTIRYNSIDGVTIDSGGVITVEDDSTIYGNRMTNGTKVTNGNDEADAFEVVHGNVDIYNNICWDLSGSGVSLVRTDNPGTVTVRNNLFDVTRSLYRINVENYAGSLNQSMTATDNLVLGASNVTGTPNGSTYADRVVTSSDFIGPVTGQADAGDGIGSGFELASGSAAIGSASGSAPGKDAQDLDRDGSPDQGPLEHGASSADTTSPDSTVNPIPSVTTGKVTTVTGTATDNASGIASVRARLSRVVDGGATEYYYGGTWSTTADNSMWEVVTSVSGSSSSETWSRTYAAGVLDTAGTYEVVPYATDNDGNAETWADGRDTETFEVIDFEVTTPADGATAVGTPTTPTAAAAADTSEHVYRVTNDTEGTVWNGTAYVTDNDPNLGWLSASWSADVATAAASVDLPTDGDTCTVTYRSLI